MVIGERVKGSRAQQNMPQGDLEKRTGLRRCYVLRVEIGHTVPSIDTLEKMARALEVPRYRLVTDGDRVKKPNTPAESTPSRAANSKQERPIRAFAKCFSGMEKKNRGLLIPVASKVANRA